MLLTETTKKLYIATKHNLGGYAAGPEPFCDHAGERAIHELSLLRRQMTLDLNIYGVSYFELDDKDKLGPEDKAFLRKAGIDDPERWYRPPWYRRLACRNRRCAESPASEDGISAASNSLAQTQRRRRRRCRGWANGTLAMWPPRNATTHSQDHRTTPGTTSQ